MTNLLVIDKILFPNFKLTVKVTASWSITISNIFVFSFSLAYIHCTGGIHCANSKQTYIVRWLDCPHYLPPDPLPVPLKTVARGFIILFPMCIWSPSTIFPHLHLLHSSFFLLSLIPPTCNYFIVLCFIFNSRVNVQGSFSMYPRYEYI
jgi:hypothetical protein